MRRINLFVDKTTRYLYVNRWRLIFLIPLFMFIDILSKMPYLGLLLIFENKLILFWILIVFVLRIGYKGTSFLAFALLALSIFSSVRERTIFSEQLGIVIVVLVFIAFIQSRIKSSR